MLHFSPSSREIENGWVEFQVKATDELSWADDGQSVRCVVEMAHLRYWYWETAHPFILVFYDAQRHCAYWVDIQSYVDRREIDDQETLVVHIPRRNTLTVKAIDRFREESLARQTRQ